MPERKDYTPPSYLLPGAEITVSLSGSVGTVRATVLRHLPITLYQVILCELTAKSNPRALSVPLGTRFVLKIYDPRYVNRSRSVTPQWTYASEREAYPRHNGQLINGKWVVERLPHRAGLDNWELFLFLRCKTSQVCEVESYKLLAPLQGAAVPLFYGDGVLDLHIVDSERAVHPPVILIEYIEDAVTLADVDVRVLDPAVVASFIDAIDRMGELGVTNTDLNPGNYLFSPAHRPNRIVLIDYAMAAIREVGESEESWQECVRSNGADRYTKKVLEKKFLNAGLPVPSSCANWLPPDYVYHG